MNFNDISKTIKKGFNLNLTPPKKTIKIKKNLSDIKKELRNKNLNKKKFKDIYLENNNAKDQSNSDKAIIEKNKII